MASATLMTPEPAAPTAPILFDEISYEIVGDQVMAVTSCPASG